MPVTGSAILPLLRSGASTSSGERDTSLEDEVTALFDQFRNPLLRYLWNFGLSPANCEEVLQEVFLSLFQHLARRRPLTDARAWLFRVAHNIALKQRYRSRREAEAAQACFHASAGVDSGLNPEELMAHSQTQRHLTGAVAALSETDRRCLFLRAEGLRYREIGGILNISLGAVSLSLARSLARLARVSAR